MAENKTPPQPPKDSWGRGPAWWARLGEKERKLIIRVCGILLLGLVLMYGAGWGGGGVFGNGSAHSGADNQALIRAPEAAISASEEDLEAKLLRILSAIEGAGKVQVALSFCESSTAEYAANSDLTENTSEETDDKGGVSHSSQRSESIKLVEINAAPVLVKEAMPRLSGAVIVAAGAGDPYVREKLHKAARILLALPANRIEVLKSE